MCKNQPNSPVAIGWEKHMREMFPWEKCTLMWKLPGSICLQTMGGGVEEDTNKKLLWTLVIDLMMANDIP